MTLLPLDLPKEIAECSPCDPTQEIFFRFEGYMGDNREIQDPLMPGVAIEEGDCTALGSHKQKSLRYLPSFLEEICVSSML